MDFHAANKSLFPFSHPTASFLNLVRKLRITRKVFGAFPAHCKPIINADQIIVVSTTYRISSNRAVREDR
jgi:hypothetical protein